MLRLDETGEGLPKVVESHSKILFEVDVEVPLHSKVQNYDLIVKPDLYDRDFVQRPHWNWAGTPKSKPQELLILSVLKLPVKGEYKGLKNTMSGFHEFEIPELKVKSKNKKANIESYLEKKICARAYEINDSSACSDIRDIEKKFPQYFSAMDITVMEIKDEQTNPQEMFQNKEHSPEFDRFLKIMDITLPFSEKKEFDWDDKKNSVVFIFPNE